ncbi:hypothetical protein HNP84_002143 [Thermocatellispora tengchongensis]|uniref:Uncharacterized protein n=1 Tax=Thermocatellispora tengchongensis TaxID=1073253 RepID=A0A840P5D4_9ACTN|nr:hypothetical protein [Thermocatellispora tengchongensis]
MPAAADAEVIPGAHFENARNLVSGVIWTSSAASARSAGAGAAVLVGH